MARKSANDRITSRYEPPSVLASRPTQSERSRKLISFRGLAAHFLLWIRFTLKKKTLYVWCHVAANALEG